MKRFRHRILLSLWLMACVGAAPQPVAATTVAVMEYAVPTNDGSLAWARLGVPDLLTAELSAHGWEVLDRETIGHVLQEPALDDRIRAGQLVGAKYVLTGKVSCPAPGQITVEAMLADVENLETGISTVQTGLYPDDLGEIVRRIVAEMTRSVAVTPASVAHSRAEWSPRPETVISFNRGLAAYSAGYPEIAVPWFIVSYRMEPRFAFARAWEVHAYEAMGLGELAQRAREIHGKKLAEQRPPEPETAKSIALARPLLVPAGAWSTAQINEIMRAFSDGLGANRRVSLLQPEAIGRALREQDIQLAGFFADGTAARYGQWRLPDGILQSRFERRDNETRIELWLDAPMVGNDALHETEIVAADALPRDLPRMIERLLSAWPEASAAIPPVARQEAGPMTETDLADLSERYRPLAQALHSLRQRKGHEEWRTSAEAYRQLDIWLMQGAAVDQAIASIDLGAPGADLALFQAWSDFKFMIEPGQQRIYQATPELILGLKSNLLSRFPDSVCATALRFENGWQAWRKMQFEEAGDWMRMALDGLSSGHSAAEDEAILAATYVWADSLSRAGKPEEALPIFRALNEYLAQHPHEDEYLPYTLRVDDRQQVASGERFRLPVTGRIRNAAAGRKHNPKKGSARTKLRAAAFYNPDGRCEGHLTTETVMPAMESLVEAWQTTGPFELCGTSDLNIARYWLYQMAKSIGEEERRAWFPEFVGAYLRRMKLKPAWDPENFVPADVVPHVEELWTFYCLAGLRSDGLVFLDRFLGPDVAPATAFEALMQADRAFGVKDLEIDELESRLVRLAERLPGGERDIPGGLWAQMVARQVAAGDWEGALEAMKKGLASHEPADPGDEVARVVIRQALKRRTEEPFAAVRTTCGEYGLLPWVPLWWQWYDEGLWAAAAGEHEIAISCFQVLLQYLEAPQEMDPTATIELASNQSPIFVQGKNHDFDWFSEQASRRNSAKFQLAISYLATDQHEKAATCLREIASEVGQDKLDMLFENHAGSGGHRLVNMGVMASALLHCLHYLNEIHASGEPVLDRDVLFSKCLMVARELNSIRCYTGAGIIYDMAKRVKALRRSAAISPQSPP